MKTVIEIENLSKIYDLGLVGTGTLSKDLNRAWAKLRGKPDPYASLIELNDRTQKSKSGTVYALKDINFSVQKGEVLGIIGKNGAGKSTLLKILSQITSPSTGEIKIKGRVASLLEVGTGMHPEMTARQNIYLNGSIMGMRRQEITSKLDEIIEFAGIAKYVDTPIKRFSSGMQVRLAFAVAAFLEPEILIVDEVLAVGDAEFQKKAIGKMQDVSKGEGRTVLFVSHNMAAVKSLCTKAMVIENGTNSFVGDCDTAISRYLSMGLIAENHKVFSDVGIKNVFDLNGISIRNKGQVDSGIISESSIIEIESEITLYEAPERYHITYHLINDGGDELFSFSDGNVQFKVGKNKLSCFFPENFLQSGTYYIHFLLVQDKKKCIYKQKDIISFRVVDGEREIGVFMGREPGSIRPKFEWNLI